MLSEDFLRSVSGKPYQAQGTGNPGYDCFSISLDTMEESLGVKFPDYVWDSYWTVSEQSKDKILNWLFSNGFRTIWSGRYKSLTDLPMQVGDLLLFRGLQSLSPSVYVGNLRFITSTNQAGVEIFSLVGFRDLPALCRILRYSSK